MQKLVRFLPLLFLFAGCASNKDRDKDVDSNPYEKWERQQDKDEDSRFFYGSWLHSTDSDEPMYHPNPANKPPSTPPPQ